MWADTVELHREQVRMAILDAVDDLMTSQGVLGITMSQLAGATGIGRPALYKYFGDVEDVLTAWHHRHVASHLTALRQVAEGPADPADRLRLVLQTYGRICQQRGRQGADSLVAALHRGDQAASHERQLRDLLVGLLSDAVDAGVVRNDMPLEELASFSLHALTAAGEADTPEATTRLTDLVMSGLRVSAANAREQPG